MQVATQMPVMTSPQYPYYMAPMYQSMAMNSPPELVSSPPMVPHTSRMPFQFVDVERVEVYYPYAMNVPYYPYNKPYNRPTNRWNTDPAANLFIYNVPPTFTDGDLRDLFAPFGTVLSAKVGRPRGAFRMIHA